MNFARNGHGSSLVATVIHKADGSIVEWRAKLPAGLRPPGHLRQLVSPADASRFEAYLLRARLETESEVFYAPSRLRVKGGHLQWMTVRLEGERFQTVLWATSGHRTGNGTEPYHLAGKLLDSVQQPLLILDPELNVVSVNSLFTKSFGFRKREIARKSLLALGAKLRCDPSLARKLQKVARGKSPLRDVVVQSTGERPGRAQTFLCTARRFAEGGKVQVLVTFENITRRMVAEGELLESRASLERMVEERTRALLAANERSRSLAHRLEQTQERERRAVARELHDEVGQILTGVKLLLEMSMRGAPNHVRASLSDAYLLSAELQRRVQHLSLDLHPHLVEDIGLIGALRTHFKRYEKYSEVAVKFEHEPLRRKLHPRIECTAFRIVQEALTNVARHARSKMVKVRLWTDPRFLGMQVQDDGIGFAEPRSGTEGPSFGFGIASMKERAELLGGHFTLESQPGQGTTLTVELPLSVHHHSPG